MHRVRPLLEATRLEPRDHTADRINPCSSYAVEQILLAKRQLLRRFRLQAREWVCSRVDHEPPQYTELGHRESDFFLSTRV